MAREFKVGVLGATGMVGQRFVSLLEEHPWFEVTAVAASASSAGKPYRSRSQDAGRWRRRSRRARRADRRRRLRRRSASPAGSTSCSARSTWPRTRPRKLEEDYARAETPVVSNNSAHRWTPDVPMMIPEINADHASVIEAQRKRLGTKRGFIAVKPNCSIQSYVPAIHPLLGVRPQRRSRSARTRRSRARARRSRRWPEMVDNVIPFIKRRRREDPSRSR